MIRLSLLTIALFSSISVQAAYVIKVPMEQNRGGPLQNNSIAFVSGNVGNGGNGSNPTTPDPTPEEPKPEEPSRESVCIAAKQNVISIAAAQNLGVTVKYITPMQADRCVLMVMSIGKFTDKASLVNFGNSILSLNIENYSVGVQRYSSSTLDTFISSGITDVNAQADKLWSRYLTDKK
ncbi:hypothetical protein ATI02_3346 [Pseudomonas baetica]|uniref:Uncharacterized protein n=1 Tax=Pseudomonas baetica TaxID=674054 RepID=A0ABX4Q0X1_9PSED|nr:hypothetical protein [Pseudomonas baetica]PKA70441.1 hypothetical protein ATI02_3346 [Pseudomonas baetica]